MAKIIFVVMKIAIGNEVSGNNDNSTPTELSYGGSSAPLFFFHFSCLSSLLFFFYSSGLLLLFVALCFPQLP
jgi:hypothetical protein